MFARVNIVYERRENALQLSRSAIVDADGTQSVFVVANGKAEQRPVQTGLANNGWVEITGGLKGDEQVIVVGQGGLKTGTAVKVVDTTATAAVPPPGQGQVTATGEPLAATPGKTMQLIDFAIRRRVTVIMCTVAIALFGFVSLSRLNLNLLPDLSYPTLTIRTELPGARRSNSRRWSRGVEEAVSIIRNVRQVRSVSRSGSPT